MRKSWDYIIVGAGTAGCVLAARLSENPSTTVLLLEAGGPRLDPWLHIPVGYFKTVGNPRTDWMYRTEAEPGLGGRSIPWPRGKVIGGSGSINGLVYVRGQPEDYDAWRDAGCDGWGWSDLLPFFIRSERQERGASEFHGDSGPLSVSDDRTSFEILRMFDQAAVASGLPANSDCNDGAQEGVGYYQTMSRNGVRSSTASGYLRRARRRPNLKVVSRRTCERITIEAGRATGVQCRDRKGRSLALRANNEVLLCAGAIGSPQLLMLSGVGNGEELMRHGIHVHADRREVGRNLQDHLKIHNSYRTSIPTLNDRLNSIAGKIGIGLQYVLTRRGPMTMGAAPVFAFARSHANKTRPDVQFHVLPWSSSDPSTGRMHPFSGFTASICPLRPESRGEIRLRSADPSEPPVIRANYLATDKDCRTAVDAIRLSRSICRRDPLNGVIEEEFAPGAALQSDDEILKFVRQNASTVFHPVGTCRMGSDSESVVDPQLRVRHVDSLRVVDASIMPSITSGNTNAPVIAIAEKASDLIKATGSAE